MLAIEPVACQLHARNQMKFNLVCRADQLELGVSGSELHFLIFFFSSNRLSHERQLSRQLSALSRAVLLRLGSLASRSHGMVRPVHEIWVLFSVVESRSHVKKHPDVKCRFCDVLVKNAQPSRNLLQHAVKCALIPDNTKARWKLEEARQRREKRQDLQTPQKVSEPSETSSVGKHLFGTPRPTGSSARNQRRSPRLAPRRTQQENNMRVATVFYATGIPFHAVKNPHFRAMFDYQLPSRHQLAEGLLDAIYKREKERAIETLSGATHLALVTDGWTNTNNDSVINFVLTNPRTTPVFWKSVNTHGVAHTAEYVAQGISDAIGEIEAQIGEGSVTAVVTDNAANMKAAWKILESRHEGLVCTGCTAHGMNLLVKDVFEDQVFFGTLKNAATLSRFIRSRQTMWDRFRELLPKMKRNEEHRHLLSVPVPTRWYTQERCIRSVFENKDVIFVIFSDTSLLEQYAREASKLEEVLNLVKDETFWQTAGVVVKLIQPINVCLAAFERDNCSISLVYHQFEWLRQHAVYTSRVAHCSSKLQRVVLERIEERQRQICSNTLVVANFLDQTKSVYGVIESDVVDTIDHAVRIAQRLGHLADVNVTEFHHQLVEFGLTKRSWSPDDRQKHANFSPLDWWTLTNQYSMVKQFAAHILSIPTSSASSERSWSIHGFIHSKNRNRLSVERVNKLVFIYTNLAKRKTANHILYELFPVASDGEEEEEDDNDSEGGACDSDCYDSNMDF